MKISNTDSNQRLDIWVSSQYTDVSRSQIKNAIVDGNILVNGSKTKAGYILRLDDEVTIDLEVPRPSEALPEKIDLEIVYEDEDLAVINKPKGMVVHPATSHWSGTLVNALLYKFGNLSGVNGGDRPGIVHRLDKDTSGLLVVAKNDYAHKSLQSQIQSKECKRYYMALVVGNLKEKAGKIENYIGRSKKDRKKMAVVSEKDGRLAITHYEVVKSFYGYDLVRYELKTGRTHQIRVHTASIGHPIVADEVYGIAKNKWDCQGQVLHAYRLELTQPKTNKRLIFEVELPDYFKKIVDSLVEK